MENMKKDITIASTLLIMDACHIETNASESFVHSCKELKSMCYDFISEHLQEIDFHIIRERKLHRLIAAEILIAIQKKERNYSSRDMNRSSSPTSWTSVRMRSDTERTNPAFLVRSSYIQENNN